MQIGQAFLGGWRDSDKVGSILYVASPIYKQRFDLVTGQCLDDTEVKLATYQVERDEDDVVVTYQLSEDSSLTTIEIDMA
ncbi:nitrite reductase (NAD(P)H) small subunit [Psychrobacter okhotskensis]|uniref:nitrite reductase (NAD(P)H) small subunit n=1 Tax=Psychrobacter okhotskensis TaxID=212403 RepID=UPI003D0246BF